MEAYCVRCKEKREMTGGQEVPFGKSRKAMRGNCVKCGTTMMRALGKK